MKIIIIKQRWAIRNFKKTLKKFNRTAGTKSWARVSENKEKKSKTKPNQTPKK